ncbi:restriction endonuclease subunit S [Salinicola sp. JS01]|uniref:restriction endonuclease subunit S n=1 Tax=Salinicola sp. JS01 TaxID=3050071 RepID=UPI00255BBB55|nr:restriction endonuclease subunit S [Salinicola sp. JS01]WIX32647.1 restriction endonuclease subunit S [Salinicola sp. JS01]
MNEMITPTEWVTCTIGDVCALNPKAQLSDDLDIGFMPMAGMPTSYFGDCRFEARKWSNAKKGFTQFRDNDVVFAKITPCFENSKAAIIKGFPNEWGAGSTEYYVLRPYSGLVRPELLYAVIKSKKFMINGALNMSGSVGHKRVPKDFVSGYEFTLPPLAEQKVIADRLDTLLAQVESTKARLERIPEILKRFRQSVLAAAVSGGLTKKLSATDWKKTTIGEVALEIRYGTSKKCSELTSGTPVLRIPNVGDGFVVKNKLKFAEFDLGEIRKLELKPGDLLLVRSNGSLDLVGKTALVKDGDAGFVFAGYLIRLRLDAEVANPAYISIFLRSPEARAAIEEKAKSTSGVNNINSKELASLCLKLPVVDEQTEIVRRVDQLFAYADTVERQVNSALERVNQLTQSILAKAFRGELTAQWREDNPALISGENSAEALLERIKAERAAQTPKKRTKKKASA